MENTDRKQHWESIYQTKEQNEVSWHEPIPETSLGFIAAANLSKEAKIIDVGGGDSHLADVLLKEGFTDISVLDIAAPSLEKAVKRLGKDAEKIKWIIADVTTFQPTEAYDLWHDRAAFHFLTDKEQIEAYVNTVRRSLKEHGIFIVGTFSEDGPTKCSGIEIKQYNEKTLEDCFSEHFIKQKCTRVDHKTPSGAIQNFVFCSFKKKVERKEIGEIVSVKQPEEVEFPYVFLDNKTENLSSEETAEDPKEKQITINGKITD